MPCIVPQSQRRFWRYQSPRFVGSCTHATARGAYTMRPSFLRWVSSVQKVSSTMYGVCSVATWASRAVRYSELDPEMQFMTLSADCPRRMNSWYFQ